MEGAGESLSSILSTASKNLVSSLSSATTSDGGNQISSSSRLESSHTSTMKKTPSSSNEEKTVNLEEASTDDAKTVAVNESIDDSSFSVIPLCKVCEDPILSVNGSIHYEDVSTSVHGRRDDPSLSSRGSNLTHVICTLCNCMFHTNCVASLRSRKIPSSHFKCNKCFESFGVSALFGGGLLQSKPIEIKQDNLKGVITAETDISSPAKKIKLIDESSSTVDATSWGSLAEFGTMEPIHFDYVISQLLMPSSNDDDDDSAPDGAAAKRASTDATLDDKSELETLRQVLKNDRDRALKTHPPEFEYIRICRDLRTKSGTSSSSDSPVKRYINRGDNNDEAAVCVCTKESGVKDGRKKRSNAARADENDSRARTGCGDGCLNRASFLECTSRTCVFGKDSDGVCSNRAIQRRQNAKTRPELAMGGKGWGLFAAEEIKAGTFIAEYVGDILDENACEERMKHYSKRHAQHYYMLEVRSGFIIDAGMRGNETRFINHSCAANAGAIKMRCKKEGSCLTETLDEEKDVRVGIYALNDIPVGGEITYDYNFVSYGNEGERWACECGAGSCRKKLGNNKKDVLLDDLDFEHIQLGQSDSKSRTTRLVPHAGYTFFGEAEANAANVLAMKRSSTSSRSSVRQSSQEIVFGPSYNFLHVEPNNRFELVWAQRQKLFLLGSKVQRPTRYDSTENLEKFRRRKSRHGLLSCMLSRCERIEKGLQFLTHSGTKSTKTNMRWSIYGFSTTEFLRHYEASEEDAQPAEEDEDNHNLFLSTSESPKNDNSCSKCQGIGSLLCCDECSRAYHFSCVGKLESDIDSSEKWRCPECSKASRAARLHASSTSVGLLDQVRVAEVKNTLDAITILAGRMN